MQNTIFIINTTNRSTNIVNYNDIFQVKGEYKIRIYHKNLEIEIVNLFQPVSSSRHVGNANVG